MGCNEQKVLYVIHTSPKRIDVVNGFLVPCFKNYGIQNIVVWNDSIMKGQLDAWTDCARWILEQKEYRYTWHLEDDVIPCKMFKEISETVMDDDMITQGFITDYIYAGFKGKTGFLSLKDMPYGMQCIGIPNKYLNGYVQFVDEYVKNGLYRKRQYDCGTLYSDNVFLGYMKKYHSNVLVNVMGDCMVEHIDYLIGGRSVRAKNEGIRKAVRFDNREEVERLKEWSKRRNTSGKTEN